jgi:phosphopantothenoylcysteine decarboxylase / phosphopantothenate---cysteine ligase
MQIHPSKEIIGTEGNELIGKKIALCITGSVAAVRSPELARLLMRHGAEVFSVMSPASKGIIHPDVVEWATGNPVVTELSGKIEHIALGGNREDRADLILVAPATSNTISKMSGGIDDTTVTSVLSVAFGSKTPIIVVPAMHECMYCHPILLENIEKLKTLGVEFVDPVVNEGKAKIANNETILEAVLRKFSRKDMVGLKILVTAGPTLEYLDPIRIITNKSSGKMGVAIAVEASRRGADVTLVCNPETVAVPSSIPIKKIETTKDMLEAVETSLISGKYNILVAAAAAADYSPAEKHPLKIATRDNPLLTMKLLATKKIIERVKELSPDTFLVGFKAEHDVSDEALMKRGRTFFDNSRVDLLILNDVGRVGSGFRAETNEVFIMDRSGEVRHIPLTSKSEIAGIILEKVLSKLNRTT